MNVADIIYCSFSNTSPAILHGPTAHWTLTGGTCELHEDFWHLLPDEYQCHLKSYHCCSTIVLLHDTLDVGHFLQKFWQHGFQWCLLCRSIANGQFCSIEYVSEGHYNHLHPVTNKRLLNTSSLSDIAAVMSASALTHAENVGSKIQEHESTDLYFPFLLVSAQRTTSLVTWYWYTRIDLWLWFCWLCMSFGATRSSLRRRLMSLTL